MVDVTTRSWERTDFALLAHFESKFPQTLPWKCCQLRRPMPSALTSALLTRISDPELLFNVPRPRTNIRNDGTSFALTTTSIRSSDVGTTLSQSSKSLDNGTEMDALPPATTPSELEQWRTHYLRSARRPPGCGPLTSENMSMATSISACKVRSEPISVRIPRPSELKSSQPLSSSSCWPKHTASQDMMIPKQ
jgi:hypothetical protein